MKAISLRLKAFGPYNEEQHIRFEELGNESIFLVTGPTGAGKTTIFDAICYALYGRASGSDREQDSLRSHFAGENAQTEVRYSFALKGMEYLVVRNPRQQKKKERGEGFTEEPAKAELYEMKNGEPVLLSARVKDVNDMLETRLGLDYEQFRKMVMIPQGEFRKLISENSKEREEILQRIFRTHFYEQITEELKNQAKELKLAIQDLEWKINQEQAKIEWKTSQPEEGETIQETTKKLGEEIRHMIREKKEKEALLEDLKKEYKRKQEAFFTGKQLADKFTEQSSLEKDSKELAAKSEEMGAIQEQLQMAQKAEMVKPYEEQVTKREREWQEAAQRWSNQQQKTKEMEECYKKTQKIFEEEKDKETEREKAKEEIEQKKKQLDTVQAYNLLEQQTKEAAQKKEKYEQIIKQKREAITKAKQRTEELDKQRDQREGFMEKYYKFADEEKNHTETLKKINLFRQEQEELLKKRSGFQRVQEKYQACKEKTEKAADKVAFLEKERRENQAIILAEHLQEGAACPVCGSSHHPAPATGRATSTSEDELRESTIKKEKLEKELQTHREELDALKSDGKYQRKRVDQLAEEAGITQDEQAEWGKFYKQAETNLHQVKKQKSFYAVKLQELDRLSEQRADLLREIDQNNQQLDSAIQLKETADKDWFQCATQLENLKENMQGEIQDETALTKRLEEAQITHQKLIENWEAIQQRVQSDKEKFQQAATVQDQLKQVEKAGQEKYYHEKQLFTEKYKQAGFTGIDEYHSAAMEEADSKRLENLLAEYDNKKEIVESKLRELAELLKDKEFPDVDGMSASLEKQDQLLQETNEELQRMQFYIKQHQQIADSLGTLLSEYETAAGEYYDIGELADLAKGDNHLRLSFERYVLASFLDEILLQANIRLDQLTEHRYQLVRSDQIAKRGAQSGLDLEVLDHHTGQKRSVKTLSGGEGFKAALSLALGMSDVVQAHAGGVQLETLFIDEGFGTLDELSLEQAIDCLKSLQQGNRLLGIISHVPQLKEEIQAKLQVTLTEKGSSAEFVFR